MGHEPATGGVAPLVGVVHGIDGGGISVDAPVRDLPPQKDDEGYQRGSGREESTPAPYYGRHPVTYAGTLSEVCSFDSWYCPTRSSVWETFWADRSRRATRSWTAT